LENRAAFVLDNRQMKLGAFEFPQCGEDDVVLRVMFLGVCGSDVHFYQHGEPEFPDVYPFVPGHECACEVVEVGRNVTSLAVGDRVAVEPGITCGKCEWCKGGKYNLCPRVRFLSAPTYHGALRNYLAHPAELCFKLPDNVSSLEGALIEPLSVAFNATRQSGITIGQKAVILGSGCIGLVTLLALNAMGVGDVTVVDQFDIRLDKARQLGAGHVVNASRTDAVEAVLDITGGQGPDFVFEAAGNQKTTAQAVLMAKRGGTIVVIGNVVGQTPFNFQMFVNKELQLKSSFRYRNVFPAAIEAVATRKVDISQIVSKVYDFERSQQAFEDSISNKEAIVKAVVQVGSEPGGQ
jgi:L-iditol 2-dehydrogenase